MHTPSKLRSKLSRNAALSTILVLAMSNAAAADKTTHVYKKVGALEIKADVYTPPKTNGNPSGPRPVVVWIHGGALINGHREGVFKPMHDALLERGCVVVSIDYRLAPETKLPEIVTDVEDALGWVRTQGPKLFSADPERVAVFGGSAGGFLTLVAGTFASPPPRALVSLWGYGEVLTEWGTSPSPHARHHQLTMSDEQMVQLAKGPPVSDSRDRRSDGGAFYQSARRTGTWPKWVSGFDPVTQSERIQEFLPLHHVNAEFPPTLFIHGTADTDVPFKQSQLMVAELINMASNMN